ncbi:NAD(P)H-dependent oxidoreductase subunit E [Herbaspirillum sp. ST 5-3]|uniref:NAD(P)H-dependent oxidoreductase subunit E n=1 Tax=Oxalobacteraceae TaxID=75682 RepID=UPI0010A544B8|nr:NAD(P)H-dependent oxidoreductase subunit E [Herbaspirillum sp. ST 5-3]
MRHDDIDINRTVRAVIEAHTSTPGHLLPALHAIQDELSYIPSDAVIMLAEAFNLSRAEVHGVISFYHDFCTAPSAKHVVRVCCAEACQSMGSDRLLARAEKGTNKDIAVEQVYCLGHCAVPPSVMIDNTPYAHMTCDRLDKLINNLKEST